MEAICMKRLYTLFVIFLMATSLISAGVAFGQTRKGSKVQKTASPAPAPATTTPPMVVEVKAPNAKLVKYIVGYNTYWLLLPDNIDEYKYLGKYPFTAFLFVNWFNETKLDQIPVKTLMQGSLAPGGDFYYILAFGKIEGFQDTADRIKNLDEFEMSSKKNEVIAKLKECYRNYLEDYKKYLRGNNGYYVFKNGKYPRDTTTELTEYPHGTWTSVRMAGIDYQWSTVSRDDYSFDKQAITLELLGPIANSGMEESGMWESEYERRFYQNHQNGLPKKITVPMVMDDAKKLFGSEKEAFCQSLLAVQPKFGFFGNSGTITQMVTNFGILKIGKTCFRKDTGFESPVLMFEIGSTPAKPLY